MRQPRSGAAWFGSTKKATEGFEDARRLHGPPAASPILKPGMRRILDELGQGLREMPRGAVVTVAAGLVLTLLVGAVNLIQWESSADLEWSTVEAIPDPPPAELPGGGSFELTRMSLSAIPQTDRGDLLFRVSGVATIDSGKRPATLRCAVSAPVPAKIARTPKKRAAWPRPSDDLRLQDVPELLVIDFSAEGAEILGMPVRDSFRRYSDSRSLITVEWDGFADRSQNWVWDIPKGTGEGPATLGFAVVFKSARRPETRIVCESGGAKVVTRATQGVWPIPGADWEG